MVTLLNLMTENPDLLSNIVLPDGVDRDTLTNQILFEGCTLFPIYQDPKLFRSMAEHYFVMRYQIHAELFKTLAYDYEPLENYDRIEDRTHSGNENINRNLATEETAGTGTTSGGKTEQKVSAYNEDGYQPQNLTESESTMNSNTDTEGSEDETTDRQHSGTEHARIHGNIGVTTSQQMLEAQRNVVKFSLYEFIASHFLKTFMIGIY